MTQYCVRQKNGQLIPIPQGYPLHHIRSEVVSNQPISDVSDEEELHPCHRRIRGEVISGSDEELSFHCTTIPDEIISDVSDEEELHPYHHHIRGEVISGSDEEELCFHCTTIPGEIISIVSDEEELQDYYSCPLRRSTSEDKYMPMKMQQKIHHQKRERNDTKRGKNLHERETLQMKIHQLQLEQKKERDQFEQEKNRLQQQNDHLQQEKKLLRKEKDRIQKELQQDKDQLQQEKKLMRRVQEENDRIQKELKQDKDQLQQQKHQLQQEKDTLHREKDSVLRENGHLQQEKNRLKLDNERLQREMEHSIRSFGSRVNNLEQREREEPHWVVTSEEIHLTQEVLGKGAYGEVTVAKFRGTTVAAKCLHNIILSPYNLGLFSREMDIASRLRHPNLVQFMGATREGSPIILTELMSTSLHKELEVNRHGLDEPTIISISGDVARALNYLHLWRPHPILHRDISSPNVLLEAVGERRWKAKLSDFGSANIQSQTCTQTPGNPYYASPEAGRPRDHSPAMDVYSYGVLVVEMVVHEPPGLTVAEKRRQMDSMRWRGMRDIAVRCVEEDRHKRPSISQVLGVLANMK